MPRRRKSPAETLRSIVADNLRESANAKVRFAAFGTGEVTAAARAVHRALAAGRRVFVCGNGGSAADAQHFAAELEGRYLLERRALPVIALTTNSSTLTAIGNDYGYEATFSRQVEAHARRGDVLVAISTSGNSANVLAAARAARRTGAVVIGLTGRGGGKLAKSADLAVRAPSDRVARIQECHIAAIHAICAAVEEAMFGR